MGEATQNDDRTKRATERVAIRSAADVKAIRSAASALERVFASVCGACHAGRTKRELNTVAFNAIRNEGARSLFNGYRQGSSPPFDGVVCLSVNDEVVHGLPDDTELGPGDLLSIDVGLNLNGWCADSASSLIIAPADADRGAVQEALGLIAATRSVLKVAIDEIRPGRAWSEIATVMEQRTRDLGCDYVSEYVGHGIGVELHEPPKVPSYATAFTGADFVLQPGMVLALEPLLTRPATGGGGRPCSIRVSDNGWTVRTRHGGLACHEERMLLVTQQGCEVLTGGVEAAAGEPI